MSTPLPAGAVPGPAARALSFRSADGLTLRGAEYGAGAHAIVFAHGNGLPVQSYAPAFPPLLERARILALNARGHGGSDVPADFPDWSAPLADLRDFIAARAGPPVILMGHSFGANLSLWLAATHPALVRGLVLLDPIIPYRRSEEWPEGAYSTQMHSKALERRDRWPTLEAAHEDLRKRALYRNWHDDAFALFLAHGCVFNEFAACVLACPPWLEAAIFRSRPASITWRWAEAADMPALVVRGAATRISPLAAHEDLATALPQGRLLILPGGHTFAQEQPAATGKALAEALAPWLDA